MSTLSDVQALYGGVRDTWAKSQAHVIAHIVFGGVVFVLCGATTPNIWVPRVDPKQISSNEWFVLAKETGIIYVSFVIPLVILTAYAALLRAGGQLLVAALMLVLPPSSRRMRHRFDSAAMLEPLALTLGEEDFALSELDVKAQEYVLKHSADRDEHWKNFQEGLSHLTKNSQIYLGDFLLFLLGWVVVFRYRPESTWVRENEMRFWPVALMLTALIVFARFRVSRAMIVVPSMLRAYVSMMIRVDPDSGPLLAVSEERRERVRRRLNELLREAHNGAGSQPSLAGYLRCKAGVGSGTIDRDAVRPGWPFRGLYDAGRRFSWDEKRHTRYDRKWLKRYAAYRYYRLHLRLSALGNALWQLARYIVTGVP